MGKRPPRARSEPSATGQASRDEGGATAPPTDEPAPLEALAEALDSVGDRWTLLVVAALLDGPRRFGDLQRELPGIAPNVLTSRLRHLQRARLAVAQPYSQRPPRFVYELTEEGRDLAAALRQLSDWGARHHEAGEPPRHSVCGTPMEARWYCPTCERPVEDDEADDLHYA